MPSKTGGGEMPSMASRVGITSSSEAIPLIRRPCGKLGPRIIRGTWRVSWKNVRLWSTPPCSINSSPWSDVTIIRVLSSMPFFSRSANNLSIPSSICRIPASYRSIKCSVSAWFGIGIRPYRKSSSWLVLPSTIPLYGRTNCFS